MTFGSGEIDPSQSRGGGSPARTPPRPRQPSHLQPPRAQPHSRSLWPQGRRRRMARLRHRFPERPRGVFGVSPRLAKCRSTASKKIRELARRQGAYSVISATGLIVRRGHELDRVLRSIDTLSLVAN